MAPSRQLTNSTPSPLLHLLLSVVGTLLLQVGYVHTRFLFFYIHHLFLLPRIHPISGRSCKQTRITVVLPAMVERRCEHCENCFAHVESVYCSGAVKNCNKRHVPTLLTCAKCKEVRYCVRLRPLSCSMPPLVLLSCKSSIKFAVRWVIDPSDCNSLLLF